MVASYSNSIHGLMALQFSPTNCVRVSWRKARESFAGKCCLQPTRLSARVSNRRKISTTEITEDAEENGNILRTLRTLCPLWLSLASVAVTHPAGRKSSTLIQIRLAVPTFTKNLAKLVKKERARS